MEFVSKGQPGGLEEAKAPCGAKERHVGCKVPAGEFTVQLRTKAVSGAEVVRGMIC